MATIPPALAGLPLACPLDGLALAPGPHGLVCPAGHNHDVARAGYASLLPMSVRPSKAPGDDARMVAARRRALEAGLFAPVCDALEACVHEALDERAREASAGTPAACLVDAGCGEGWYTDRLRAALAADASRTPVSVLGIDVSKPAVHAAARRYPDTGWAVANNRAVPLMGGRADVVTSLFGFETWGPWAALQVAGQHVVTVGAGPRHLVELRELVYGDVRMRDAPVGPGDPPAGYGCAGERRVTSSRTADAPGLARDVLAMTPHAHRVPAARAALLERGIDAVRTLTLDVVLRRWRRTG